jgi:hypothetical protein
LNAEGKPYEEKKEALLTSCYKIHLIAFSGKSFFFLPFPTVAERLITKIKFTTSPFQDKSKRFRVTFLFYCFLLKILYLFTV